MEQEIIPKKGIIEETKSENKRHSLNELLPIGHGKNI